MHDKNHRIFLLKFSFLKIKFQALVFSFLLICKTSLTSKKSLGDFIEREKRPDILCNAHHSQLHYFPFLSLGIAEGNIFPIQVAEWLCYRAFTVKLSNHEAVYKCLLTALKVCKYSAIFTVLSMVNCNKA